MKTAKKLLCIILGFVMLLPILSACNSSTGSNETEPNNSNEATIDPDAPLCDGKQLKLLTITSSFGKNTTEFLYDVAKAQGVEDVVVARLYISGCSLKQHAENAKSNIPAYEYTKHSSGNWEKMQNITMEYGLKDEDWDVIFIQQGAAQAPLANTYGDYIDKIVPYVNEKKTNPNARLVWNMTWAYQGDSTQTVFVDTFKSNQMDMYNSILNTTKEKIVSRTDFAKIIPTGTAVQNARTSYFGDTLTKDTYHLNNLGRAIAAYTLFSVLTDKELTEINLGPINSYDVPDMLILTEKDKEVIMECVNNAIKTPFEVTASTYTEK